MSTITFTGLGSGLDYSTWIDALVEAKQSSVTTVKTKNSTLQSKIDALSDLKSSYTSLQSSLQKFADAGLSTTSGMFKSMKATSSSDAVSVSAEDGAQAKNINVTVSQLATYTTLTGNAKTDSDYDISDKTLSDLGFTADGEQNIYFTVGENQQSIKVSGDTKISDLSGLLEGTGVGIEISEGKVTLKSDTEDQIVFSSAGATVNFLMSLNITGDTNEAKTAYTSNSRISIYNPSVAITDSTSGFKGINVGDTLQIGNASFEITEDTTLNSLMDEINTNKDAGVNASFDTINGTFNLTSKVSGSLSIKVGGEVANALGLSGVEQNIGQNAKYTINGKEMTSFSNTITESTSGVSGLTMTLNKVTDGETAEISIETDPAELAEALAEFVDAYNKIIKQTSTYTKVTYSTEDGETTTTKAALSFDSQLTSMLSDLKGIVNSTFGTGSVNLFSKLGISTASADASSVGSSTNMQLLQFDKEAFLEAYEENPTAIKEFLIGQDFYTNSDGSISYDNPDGTATKGGSGIFGRLKSKVDTYLLSSGYFAVETESYNSQITNNNTKIEKLEDNIESYRASLEKKFQAMDSAISTMNSNYSYITSLFSTDSDS